MSEQERVLVSRFPELLKESGLRPHTMYRLSQKHEETKLSWPTVFWLNRGKLPATSRVLLALCNFFDKEPGDILTIEGPSFKETISRRESTESEGAETIEDSRRELEFLKRVALD